MAEELQAVDLFGQVLPAQTPEKGRRRSTPPNGYYAPPGTGPAGETCKSCKHSIGMRSYSNKKRWYKCERADKKWTHGRGSDILIKSPACSGWEAE